MRLFLYILRDYIKYVVGTVTLVVFLFILFDFIHKTTKYFVEYKPRTEDILQYYLFQIPTQVAQALPIAGLLASVICMILLSRTNEITAMRAAGMGPARIGLPLAAGGMILSVTSMILGEIIVPRFAQKVHYVQQVQIEGEKDEQIADGARWVRQGQLLVNFHDFDPITQTLTRLKLIDVRPNFRPSNAVEAEFAIFEPVTKKWRLAGIKIMTFRRNGTLEKVEGRRSLELDLPIEPVKLRKDRRKANELSIRELKELIDRGEQSGVDRVPYRVEYHGKFAYPFAAFVVSLIGLKFGYKSERATETAKGVLVAFFVGISYWFVLSAGRALGLRGDIHPFLAAWAPNMVVLSIIAFDAWVNRRG
jgi:lipopolysaccharide export system permease protein